MRPAGCSGTIWTESGPRDGAVIMPQGSVTENVTWYDADLVPCAAQRKWEMCEQLKLLTVRSHLWRCRTETKARPEVIELRARDLNKKPSARKRQTKKAVNNVFSLTRRNPTSFCCRQVWFTPSWRNNACMTAYNNIIRWQCRNPQINYSDISVNAVCSQPLALTTFEKIFSEVKCKSVLEDQQSDLTSGPNRKVIVSTFFLQWLRNHSHKISFIHFHTRFSSGEVYEGPTALKRLKMHGRVITFNGNIETNASENTFETSNGKLHSFSFASCKHYTIEQQFRLTTDRVLEGLIGAETGLCRRTTVRRDNRALGRPGATEKLRRKFHDRSNNGALQVRRTLAWQHAQQSAARAPELRSAMCKYLQWTGWGGFR